MSKTMSAKRFNELITHLGETHEDAAKALGIGRRSVVRYANDQLPVPPVVKRLLLMLLKHPRTAAKIEGW